MNKNALTVILIIILIVVVAMMLKISPNDNEDGDITDISTTTSSLNASSTVNNTSDKDIIVLKDTPKKVISMEDVLSGKNTTIKVVSTSTTFVKKPVSPDKGTLSGFVTMDSKSYETVVNIYLAGNPRVFVAVENKYEGEYRIVLPAGDYDVTPVGKTSDVTCETKSISITKDSKSRLNFECK